MVIRIMALALHTFLHRGSSSMLVSLCSRAAFSSWDRAGVGPLDRPHNHIITIFQQGGLAAAREGPKHGCWNLLGLFSPFSQSFGGALASLEWSLRGTLHGRYKMMERRGKGRRGKGEKRREKGGGKGGKGKFSLDHVQHNLIAVS